MNPIPVTDFRQMSSILSGNNDWTKSQTQEPDSAEIARHGSILHCTVKVSWESTPPTTVAIVSALLITKMLTQIHTPSPLPW